MNSLKSSSTTPPVNHQINNRDMDHPAFVTRHVRLWLSTDTWSRSYTYNLLRASKLVPDLWDSLSPRTIWQPSVHYQHQHGLYSIARTFDTTGTTYQHTWRISLLSSFLLLLQFPACLVRFIWMVCAMGVKWLDNFCFFLDATHRIC